MNIIAEQKFNDGKQVIITIELELPLGKDEPLGKINITDRWKGAGKSLLDKCGFSPLKLIQIDAGQYYRTGRFGQLISQSFTFSFEKENDGNSG